MVMIMNMILAGSGVGGLRGARTGGVGGILIAPFMTEMAINGQVARNCVIV